MSSSKVKAEGPRQLKCTRCRHHGLVVPQKGHTKKCPFVQCRCWKCELITERSRINALQRKLHRDTEAQCAAGPSTTGLQPHTGNAGAPQSGPVNPRPIRVFEPWAQRPDKAGAEGPRPGSGSPSAKEDAPCEPPPPSPNPLYWRDFSPAPLPLLHIPVQMPSPFLHMPWSPVPPGLYEGSLCPLMVPPYAPALLYHPHSEPEPPDSRRVFRPPASPEAHHQEAPHTDLHPPKEEDSDTHV